ncbi:MAG: flagellar hook-basal body complex protein FliE [Verrucomicrobia bacterium]|nr:flagellar hook-basal body complex protein FliE [Verrucomicrobiota bacterium]
MNPLSAIRLPVGPEMLQAMAPAMNEAQAIPLRELGKLSPGATPQLTEAAGVPGSGFESALGRLVADVSGKQAVASEAVAGLVTGQGVPLHQAIVAMEEASVSFQLMVEVRNKLLESYQELMRMQV